MNLTLMIAAHIACLCVLLANGEEVKLGDDTEKGGVEERPWLMINDKRSDDAEEEASKTDELPFSARLLGKRELKQNNPPANAIVFPGREVEKKDLPFAASNIWGKRELAEENKLPFAANNNWGKRSALPFAASQMWKKRDLESADDLPFAASNIWGKRELAEANNKLPFAASNLWGKRNALPFAASQMWRKRKSESTDELPFAASNIWGKRDAEKTSQWINKLGREVDTAEILPSLYDDIEDELKRIEKETIPYEDWDFFLKHNRVKKSNVPYFERGVTKNHDEQQVAEKQNE